MTDDIRNVFISHIHEDDEGIDKIKGLAEKHGMTVRNGSVTSGQTQFSNQRGLHQVPDSGAAHQMVERARRVHFARHQTQLVGGLGNRIRPQPGQEGRGCVGMGSEGVRGAGSAHAPW